MSRIAASFARLKNEGQRGFIPFIMAGDPCLETTHALLLELAKAGASLIELGLPFSDPVADGPVIQRAAERALGQGFRLEEVLNLVSRVRERHSVPIVLFSYFNPLLQYGIERLSRDASRAGIDGLLVTDLVPEEAEDFSAIIRAHELDMIFLVAPTTTDERLRMIAERATGFIYAVSRAGVTGARDQLSDEAEALVTSVRRFSRLPVAVGFGISTAEQVRDVCRYADAAVVGSAIVAEIERHAGAQDLTKRIGEFARALLTIPESQRVSE